MPSYRLKFVIFFFTLLSFSSLHAKPAAVAMPDSYSAEVAQSVLQAGGNAIDAAVAVGFVLAVTYPEAGNLGGGGFMLIHHQGENNFLDFRETAPAQAHRDLFLDEKGEVLPYQSLLSYQASGVPGSVMGYWQAHQRYGKLEWSRLVEPAIKLAEQGFEVHPKLAETARWYQGWTADKTDVINFSDYFGDLHPGETFKQPELANTLRRIAQQGYKDFYHGETARYLSQQMQQNQGLIRLEDLAAYQAVWRKPLVGEWQGRQIVSAPPPSSGGLALIQLLNIKQHLAHEFEGLAHNSPEYIHLLAEIMKRVYADRAAYLGDPDFYQVPVEALLDKDYLLQRAQQVNPTRISDSQGVQPGLKESEQTTHYSIIDTEGNAVSTTITLNMPFGNGVVIEGAGFLMNNQMDDFSAKPGVANLYGVVGGEANAIEANKRMLSSMSPTLVLKQNQVQQVLGTPGGSTIITSVFQALVNLIEFEMDAQQAIDVERIHHQLWPEDHIGFHPTLAADSLNQLESMGYTVEQRRFFGDLQLIHSQSNGELSAASDHRGRGESRVFTIPNKKTSFDD
ncbi:gamma-glutamyltransferase [Thiomicrospira microaerophila]|uniref:gamma-glutamyltransferase n=1 Tax=Thiomicrospira microaerophila TaxID=406020 RepID=UPI00200BDB11|nr:gamma-glutamyltransferase [Thiomicrospira microaerophila]UQB42359.1 gamma-glutamyltransferase [Thiomicrospira microaerophila]